MKKKLDLTALLSGIHLVFIGSILCFGTIYLTLGILALPALTAAFTIGKDVIFRQFDVYDSLTKRFFRETKAAMGMMKYFPLQLLAIFQCAGMFAAQKVGMPFLSYPMLICVVFVLSLIIYIITYHVFYSPKPPVTDVIIAMFYRIQYLLIIWMIVLLLTVTLCKITFVVCFFAGMLLIVLLEIVSFLDIISYKKLKGELTELDKEYLKEDILEKL